LPFALFLWLVGGWCGLHHFYLGRDNHGLLTICIAPMWLLTSPIWFVSWVRDLFCISTYVAACNLDPEYVQPKKKALKDQAAPLFSMSRVIGQGFFGAYFSLVASNIKLQSWFGYENELIDVALGVIGCTIGVSMVACCGDQQTDTLKIFAGAVIGAVSQRYEGPVSGVFCAMLAAQYFRQYSPDFASAVHSGAFGNKNKGFFKSLTSNGFMASLMIGIIAFAAITSITVEVNGEDVSLREVIKNAMRSEGFKDFMTMVNTFFENWQKKGFEEAANDFANDFKERFDIDGEDHSYKVLGLKPGATLSEIKKAHRTLARETHPDKGGTDEKFREVQDAYETLKKIHKLKNKDSTEDAPERQKGG